MTKNLISTFDFFRVFLLLFIIFPECSYGQISTSAPPPLHIAVNDGDYSRVTSLIKSGHDVNKIYEGQTAFNLISDRDYDKFKMAKLLLKNGAQPEIIGRPLFQQLYEMYDIFIQTMHTDTSAALKEAKKGQEKLDAVKWAEAKYRKDLTQYMNITTWLMARSMKLNSTITQNSKTNSVMYLYTSRMCSEDFINPTGINLKFVTEFTKLGGGKVWFTKDDIVELNKQIKEFKGDPKLFACYQSLKAAFVKK